MLTIHFALDRSTIFMPPGCRGGGRRGAYLLAATAALVLATGSVRAADGDLDPTFRGDGTFVYAVASSGAAALAFRDDGVPLVGYTAVLAGTDTDMRVLPVPDQGFTTYCGSYHPDLGGTDEDRLTDLVVEGSRVVIAGAAAGPPGNEAWQAAFAAFDLSTCQLDSTFGGADGVLWDQAAALVPVGIVLGGSGIGGFRTAMSHLEQGVEQLKMLGLTAVSGGADPGFAASVVSFVQAYGAEEFEPHDMVRQPDGKLVVVGTVRYADGDGDVGVVRFNQNGSLDTTFSTDGLVSFAYDIVDAGEDSGFAVGVLADQRIVVAGAVERSGGARQAAVAVLTPSGGYDNGFGLIGRYAFDFGAAGGYSRIFALATQGDGKIVVGGQFDSSTPFTNMDFAFARLDADGAAPLDPSFGVDGRRVIVFDLGGFASDSVLDLALDPAGRIVATGSVQNTGQIEIGVVRLQNDYIFADGFEWGSTAAW